MTATQASVCCQNALHTVSVAREFPGEYPDARMIIQVIMKRESDRKKLMPSFVDSVRVEFRKSKMGIETTER